MARPLPTKANIEYTGTDIPPVYVEGAQAMKTPQGALQVDFYSEYIKPRDMLKATMQTIKQSNNLATMRLQADDPYGMGSGTGNITIMRRIEARFILTAPALRSILPWLQSKLADLESEEGAG